MRTYISLSDFYALMEMLDSLRGLDLLEPASYIVTWEKKPRLTINRLGNFEFTNPQEVYGVVLTFWNEYGNVVCNRRFVLAERFEDGED
jgi:hypothetical protein